MNITDYGHELRVHIEYDNFHKRNLTAIKSFEGARWNWKDKYWTLPSAARDFARSLVNTHRASFSIATIQQAECVGEIPPMPNLTTSLAINATLRPYQEQGIARAIELKKVMIGDEPGLGKTIQSIATIVGLSQFPILVICPASLKENWKREVEKFSDLKAMILNDKVKNSWHRYYDVGSTQVFITNYESLKKYFVLTMPTKRAYKSSEIIMQDSIKLFKGVIIDEAHKCKNPSTIQSKLCLRLCVGKEIVMLLTGTPVVNKPTDLFPQLAIMGQLKEFGGSLKNFKDRYCNGGFGTSNLKELNYLLNKNCYFRREKKDVIADLPDKQRQTIICDITTREEYVKAETEFVSYLKQNKNCTDADIAKKLRGEIMVKLGMLRGISAKGKLSAVKEFTEDIVDAGEKLILFCNLHVIVDELQRLFPSAGTVTGRQTAEQKQKAIDDFQSDKKCQLIICNIKTAGVGITLTASSRVAFVEFPWTYADCVQCEDRAHRIGQKENVMCTYFLGDKTVDQRMYDAIQEKKHVANAITGANDTTEETFINKLNTLFEI